MGIKEERGRYYAERAREYLEQGMSRKEAHLKANEDCQQKFDVSQRQITVSTRPYRDGREVLPDAVNNTEDTTESEDEKRQPKPNINLHDKPYIHPGDGYYYIPLSNREKPLKLSNENYKKIRKWYSNWNGDEDNIDQVLRKINMRRSVFMEVKDKLGFTHTSPPFTDEEIMEKDEDELLNDLLMQREGRLERQWQKEKWKQIKRKAEKYDDIKNGQLEPLKNALSQIDSLGYDTDHEFKIDSEPDVLEPYCALVGIADCHIGYADYDAESWSVEDSGERVLRSFNKLLNRVLTSGRPDRIVLAFLGDFFHVDREDLSTSYGTKLEAAGLVEDILAEGYRVAHNMIEMAKKIAPVKIRLVEGNHDRVTSKGLAIHLDDKFDDCDTELNFNERQYLEYQNNMFCFWHGDTIKNKNIGKVVADEASEIWGSTDNRYVCFGHVHPEEINDSHRGVTLMRLAGPSGRDEYDYKNGYDPSDSLTCIRVHPREGKIGMDYGGVVRE